MSNGKKVKSALAKVADSVAAAAHEIGDVVKHQADDAASSASSALKSARKKLQRKTAKVKRKVARAEKSARSQATKAGTKAAGAVIDDAAVTPKYVQGFEAARELPIVWKIAKGSLKNKLLFLLPIGLALNAFAPWAIS